ncbi:response regulator [Hahella sp. SMD15-11]|uniref:Transcriptional regulatory protein n=1 Tax=Thermohahella caldifontis TaxID=3142973 RepID=A0AB39USX3_9GAMM
MQTIRVIIAEDDTQIAEITRRFLERVPGFEVVGIAHDLEPVRDCVDVLKPDLLLLDIRFPSGTGLELLRELRAADHPVDVIMITGAREVEAVREALHRGVFDYILKPLAFERLEKALLGYRQHHEALRQLDQLAHQSDVDALLPRESPSRTGVSPVRTLPKGIDELTLANVRKLFGAPDVAFSAEEVGRQLGASRITARRYLEYLVSVGELRAQISYGSVGRPERRYQPAQAVR